MDLPMTLEETPGAANRVLEFDGITAKITQTASRLNTTGITPDDREILKERLRFAWSEDSSTKGATAVTTWRKKTARKSYTDIQDASNHLFLVVILAITPTECSKPVFKKVKETLLSLKSYEIYRMKLDFPEKHFFESTAAEQKFISNHRYLDFMNCLFPQGWYNTFHNGNRTDMQTEDRRE